ncbi:MAG: hypothetical protein KDA31_04510 [Phycisphaerales bacterium]|nr:hypothetical protein [Phycisphaerales bacterium]
MHLDIELGRDKAIRDVALQAFATRSTRIELSQVRIAVASLAIFGIPTWERYIPLDIVGDLDVAIDARLRVVWLSEREPGRGVLLIRHRRIGPSECRVHLVVAACARVLERRHIHDGWDCGSERGRVRGLVTNRTARVGKYFKRARIIGVAMRAGQIVVAAHQWKCVGVRILSLIPFIDAVTLSAVHVESDRGVGWILSGSVFFGVAVTTISGGVPVALVFVALSAIRDAVSPDQRKHVVVVSGGLIERALLAVTCLALRQFTAVWIIMASRALLRFANEPVLALGERSRPGRFVTSHASQFVVSTREHIALDMCVFVVS